MGEISDWDVSAPNNNSSPPDGAPEGMAPSAVNDTMRESMATLARWYTDISGITTSTGTSNEYKLTSSRTITAYAAGQEFAFIADKTNTGQATFNLNSIGALPIRKNFNTPLVAGDIKTDQIVILIYDAQNSAFQLTSHPAQNYDSVIYATDSGAADAYVITLNPAITAYAIGLHILFKASNRNTGVSTININGLGVKTIKKHITTDLNDGDIPAGAIVEIVYDGTNFQLLSNEHGRVVVNGTSPGIQLEESDVADKNVTIVLGSGVFQIQHTNDAGTIIDTPLAHTLGGGFRIGNPTGGDKGFGTINAKALYDDNTLLSPYVFEAAKTGSIDIEKIEAKIPKGGTRKHAAARRFVNSMDELDPEVYAHKWKTRGHLPALPSEQDWAREGNYPMGILVQKLMETVEVQAVHINNLHERLKALEGR